MDEKRRLLDIWIIETNTVYKEVPFAVVTDWIKQGRLLEDDKFKPCGPGDWRRLGGSREMLPHFLRTEAAASARPGDRRKVRDPGVGVDRNTSGRNTDLAKQKPLTLYPKRSSAVWWLLLSLMFVIIGIWTFDSNDWKSYCVTVFFGLIATVFLIQLVPGSTYLLIDRRGFTICNLFQKSFIAWSDVDEFYVYSIMDSNDNPVSKMVGIKLLPTSGGRIGKAVAVAIGGHEGALPDTYGKRAEELAALMTSYLQMARGGVTTSVGDCPFNPDAAPWFLCPQAVHQLLLRPLQLMAVISAGGVGPYIFNSIDPSVERSVRMVLAVFAGIAVPTIIYLFLTAVLLIIPVRCEVCRYRVRCHCWSPFYHRYACPRCKDTSEYAPPS